VAESICDSLPLPLGGAVGGASQAARTFSRVFWPLSALLIDLAQIVDVGFPEGSHCV
jgi:hypothetical protein